MKPRNRLFAALAFVTLASSAGAQGPAGGGYPNVNKPMVLAPDDTIQLLNRIVVDRAPGQRGARVDVHYSTRIPAGNAAGREAEADRLAQVVGAQVSDAGVRRVTISICETQACAETREPPRSWFVYERGIDHVWQRVRRN